MTSMFSTLRCALRSSTGAAALVFGLSLAIVGCPGTSTTGDGDGDADGGTFGPIAFEDFVQDRPAVGGDWYLYDEEGGHVLTPFEQAYLVRELRQDGPRYAAVRIRSYYDPNTTDSGVFTFATKTWEGGAWSSETETVTHNIKSSGPFCFEAFAAEEVSCQEAAWQFNFRIYKFMVRTGPIVVARPGLFARQAPLVGGEAPVWLATLETDTGLDGLPDPTTLAEVDDAAPAGWGDPSYDYDRWAPNLPTPGRVLGPRWVDEGHVGRPDVYFLLNADMELIRFTLVPVEDGAVSSGVRVTYSLVDIERNDRTIPEAVPEATTVDLPAPAAGQLLFVDFDTEDLRLLAEDLEGAHPPDLVPDESVWELALEGVDDHVEVRVSSGAILYNATANGDGQDLMEATPPL